MLFNSFCPIMPCLNLEDTQKLYETIGFKTQGIWTEYGYMIMVNSGAEVHFAETKDLDPFKNTSAGYLRLTEVDLLSERLADLDWPIDDVSIPRFGPVVDTPWGMRETAWVDPNGNAIRAGVDIDHG